MKTLRMSAHLETRLQLAAEIRGETLSEFIRQAAAERADVTLDRVPSADFSDILGVVRGGGRQARRTGDAFFEVLKTRQSGR